MPVWIGLVSREGEQSDRDTEAYKPRAVGGEFARGFEE